MDFGQEYYDMFGAQSGERIPFYMTYPMRNSFLEEAEYDRDCRRLQALYPRDARRIQEVVSGECDKMEYEGSMMFDEYPDRLSIRMLARKIYREIWDDAGNEEETADVASMREHSLDGTIMIAQGETTVKSRGKGYDGEQFGNCGPGGCRPVTPDPRDPQMQLVEVMLMQEMYQRRCRHRRCRRWY